VFHIGGVPRPIEIRVAGTGTSTARASPPHAKGPDLVIDRPSRTDEIVDELSQPDVTPRTSLMPNIANAFHAADPAWLAPSKNSGVADPPGRTYLLEEVSAGVYQARGRDDQGRQVVVTGSDPEALLRACRERADGSWSAPESDSSRSKSAWLSWVRRALGFRR
jgi:hypothetical protein